MGEGSVRMRHIGREEGEKERDGERKREMKGEIRRQRGKEKVF